VIFSKEISSVFLEEIRFVFFSNTVRDKVCVFLFSATYTVELLS